MVSNVGGDEIFRTCPPWPWGPTSLLYNGYQGFTVCKERPERDTDPSHLPVPWSRKSRAISLLPLLAVRPVQSLSACTRVHFLLLHILTQAAICKQIVEMWAFLDPVLNKTDKCQALHTTWHCGAFAWPLYILDCRDSVNPISFEVRVFMTTECRPQQQMPDVLLSFKLTGILLTDFHKSSPNTKFQGNLSSGSRADTCGPTDQYSTESDPVLPLSISIISRFLIPLRPNDPYRGRTGPLTSEVSFYIFIQQI